jgi:glutamate decarboxylase
MRPSSAYHLIHDELQTQGNPTLNMVSLVTTIMDEECDRLISENLGVNYIDTEVYRANLDIHNCCVTVPGRVVDELAEVKHRPDLLRVFGRQIGLPGVSLAA